MSDESRKKYYGIAGALGLAGIGTGVYFAWQEHVLQEDSLKPDLNIDFDALLEMLKNWLRDHMGTGNPPGGGNPSEPSIPESDALVSQQSFSSSSSQSESANHAFMQAFASISVESWMFISAAVAISVVVAAAYVYHQQQNTSRASSFRNGMK